MNICSNCNHANPPDASFCMECGTRLEQVPAKEDPKTGVKAERRQVTFLFCDLANSTALSERVDPEEFRNVIYQYHQVVEKVIGEYGGSIGNYLGDGLLAYFGYPKGLEDAPKAAVSAALASIDALKEANESWKASGSEEVNVRIGIHTGLAVLDEHLALGSAVNIASRLEGVAPLNGVVISPKTLSLVEGWFKTENLGEYELKGLDRPMPVHQVNSESGARSRLEVSKGRGLSPLLGRESQLAIIEEAWEQVKAGSGTTILIEGEAGIGKSRLVDAFLEAKPEALSLTASSSAYHTNSAFYPIRELFQEELFDFDLNDTQDDLVSKVESYLQSSNPNTELSLILEFLGIASEAHPPIAMSPFAKRQKTIESISELIAASANSNPLILILEDLHWTDASTMEWLNHFFNVIQQNKILLLTTTRTVFSPEWQNQENITKITLGSLSGEEIKELCLHQSKGKNIPEEIILQIDQKTEGVPLFIEELTKMIIESDLMVEKEDSFEVTSQLSDLPIPSTLQDSLVARLDQLEDVKSLVQECSVIGREFSGQMLSVLFPDRESELEGSLQKLLDAEILLNRKAGSEDLYYFRHSLIQDAAYDSLLKSERKNFHGHIASVIEEKFADITANQPELLANHLSKGNHPEKAIPVWLRAGQQLNQKNANAEATDSLQKGLELLSLIEDDEERNNLELDYLLTLGGCYVVTMGFPHPMVRETFNKARQVSQKISASPKLAIVYMNLLSYYFNVEDYESYDQLLARIHELAKLPEIGYWFDLIGNVPGGRIIRGWYKRADKGYERVVEIFDHNIPFPWELTPAGNALVGVNSWRMICLFALGEFNKARKLAHNHLDYLKDHETSVTLYHIYTFPALYGLEAKEYKEAQEILERYLPIARKFGDPIFLLTAEVYYNLAKSLQGDAQALEISRNMLEQCFMIGFKAFASMVSSHLSIAYLMNGDYDKSLEWTNKVLDHVNESGSHCKTSELFRLKALALRKLKGSDEEIRECFKQALHYSQEQSAKAFELRAARDFAAYLKDLGFEEDGRQLIEVTLSKFPDSESSREIEEAKSLFS